MSLSEHLRSGGDPINSGITRTFDQCHAMRDRSGLSLGKVCRIAWVSDRSERICRKRAKAFEVLPGLRVGRRKLLVFFPCWRAAIKASNGRARDQISFRGSTSAEGSPWVERMWTLILVTFVVSGTSTGGVGTTTAFLDFPSEAKCRAAADVLAGADQIHASRGNHPNISPSASYRIVARCVER